MLLGRIDSMIDPDAGERGELAPPAVVRPAAQQRMTAVPLSDGGRYGEGPQINLRAVAVTVLVHIVLLGGLLTLGASMIDKQQDRIVAFDLASATPEQSEPEPEPDVPQPQQLAVTLSPPQITMPVVPITPIALATTTPTPVAAPPSRQPAEAAPAPPPARPSPPSMVSSADLGTRMIHGRPPRYPVQSRRNREQGVVELLLILGFDGAVESISVSRSSGFERLDDAALHAVRRWRWEPTLSGGEPVKVRGVVAIPFQLEG